ncbi:MAG: methyltransferase [Gemmatimonadaceae bacterium]
MPSKQPLVLGSPDQFAIVREAIDRAGYTEAEVVRRCELPSIYDYVNLRDGRTVAATITDAFDVLLRLFLDDEALPWATVRAYLGDVTIDAMRGLGLLADTGTTGQCTSTVLLYPTRSLVIVSDITSDRHGSSIPADVVFPAITQHTEHFLAMLPETPCDELLELCAGTGIAALSAARHSGRVWATDITERSAHFARFNVLLNGITNATVACGDLYDAVGGRTFDRIVAHPPYVPGPETRVIFRDGGEDGEQVTRRIVAGLPDHLRPGGTLHCTCAVTDRVGRPFELRLRGWLGDAAPEFDVFFLPRAAHDPGEYYLRRAIQGHEPWNELEGRYRLFQRLEVEHLVYGSFVVRRRTAADAGHPPLTVRRRANPVVRGSDVLRLMEHEMAMAAPGLQERLLDLPLLVNPGMEFSLTHALVDGDWVATACHIRLLNEFAVDASVSPWIAALLVRCDGTRPARLILAELREEGMAPDEPSVEDELAPLLLALATKGVLLAPPGALSTPPSSSDVSGVALAG